jgi:hypothetical protein
MSTVYVYKINGVIIGISGSQQNSMNGIEWIEMEADDPEILQWMIDHDVRAPYGSAAPEKS